DLLVQLDAEAGRVRRQHVAVLPAQRRAQQRRREAAPVEDAFEQQQVGAAGAELDVGGGDDGAAVEVGRDLRVVRLRQGRDLLALQQPAGPAEVRLQDRGGAGGEHARELVLR